MYILSHTVANRTRTPPCLRVNLQVAELQRCPHLETKTRRPRGCTHAVMAKREYSSLLIVWDVDNIFPKEVGAIGSVLDGVKEKLWPLYSERQLWSESVLLAMNNNTMRRLVELYQINKEEIVDKIQGEAVADDISVVETVRRKNAVDQVIEQRMLEFSQIVGERGIIACISNDGDFEKIIRYCMHLGTTVVSIGTVRTMGSKVRVHNKRLAKAADMSLRINFTLGLDCEVSVITSRSNRSE